MPRRALLAAAWLACALLAFVALSFIPTQTANTVDPQWSGNPMPPCFQDATNCGGHLLGTDEIGRDLLARLVVGARVSLGVSLLAAFLALAAGVALGGIARYGGPFAKFAILCAADAVSCFAKWPFIVVLVVLFSATAHKAAFSPPALAAATATFFWPQASRAVALGGDLRDVAQRLLHQSGHDWPVIVLLLATVDFFGFGIQPINPSLGNMLSNAQMNLAQNTWWAGYLPGICLFAIVYTIELARRLQPRATSTANDFK
jgi:peptide/nickel transport system permease protein